MYLKKNSEKIVSKLLVIFVIMTMLMQPFGISAAPTSPAGEKSYEDSGSKESADKAFEYKLTTTEGNGRYETFLPAEDDGDDESELICTRSAPAKTSRKKEELKTYETFEKYESEAGKNKELFPKPPSGDAASKPAGTPKDLDQKQLECPPKKVENMGQYIEAYRKKIKDFQKYYDSLTQHMEQVKKELEGQQSKCKRMKALLGEYKYEGCGATESPDNDLICLAKAAKDPASCEKVNAMKAPEPKSKKPKEREKDDKESDRDTTKTQNRFVCTKGRAVDAKVKSETIKQGKATVIVYLYDNPKYDPDKVKKKEIPNVDLRSARLVDVNGPVARCLEGDKLSVPLDCQKNKRHEKCKGYESATKDRSRTPNKEVKSSKVEIDKLEEFLAKGKIKPDICDKAVESYLDSTDAPKFSCNEKGKITKDDEKCDLIKKIKCTYLESCHKLELGSSSDEYKEVNKAFINCNIPKPGVECGSFLTIETPENKKFLQLLKEEGYSKLSEPGDIKTQTCKEDKVIPQTKEGEAIVVVPPLMTECYHVIIDLVDVCVVDSGAKEKHGPTYYFNRVSEVLKNLAKYKKQIEEADAILAELEKKFKSSASAEKNVAPQKEDLEKLQSINKKFNPAEVGALQLDIEEIIKLMKDEKFVNDVITAKDDGDDKKFKPSVYKTDTDAQGPDRRGNADFLRFPEYLTEDSKAMYSPWSEVCNMFNGIDKVQEWINAGAQGDTPVATKPVENEPPPEDDKPNLKEAKDIIEKAKTVAETAKSYIKEPFVSTNVEKDVIENANKKRRDAITFIDSGLGALGAAKIEDSAETMIPHLDDARKAFSNGRSQLKGIPDNLIKEITRIETAITALGTALDYIDNAKAKANPKAQKEAPKKGDDRDTGSQGKGKEVDFEKSLQEDVKKHANNIKARDYAAERVGEQGHGCFFRAGSCETTKKEGGKEIKVRRFDKWSAGFKKFHDNLDKQDIEKLFVKECQLDYKATGPREGPKPHRDTSLPDTTNPNTDPAIAPQPVNPDTAPPPSSPPPSDDPTTTGPQPSTDPSKTDPNSDPTSPNKSNSGISPHKDTDGDGIPDHLDNDIDGDGIPNDRDSDMDGNGVPDHLEDRDGDGIPNGIDNDVDGDGIPNWRDNDIDGDGIPNHLDDDMDGDGIPNEYDDDTDGNGIYDWYEDKDGDGIPDWVDDDDGNDSECTLEYAPVCAEMKDGTIKTFSNTCLAEDDNNVVKIISQKECDISVCTSEYYPVCATMKNGNKKTFPNACHAQKNKDVKSYVQGECENGQCAEVYAPVCATLKDGSKRTFSNTCHANKDKNVKSFIPGECEDDKPIPQPVSELCEAYCHLCTGTREAHCHAQRGACICEESPNVWTSIDLKCDETVERLQKPKYERCCLQLFGLDSVPADRPQTYSPANMCRYDPAKDFGLAIDFCQQGSSETGFCCRYAFHEIGISKGCLINHKTGVNEDGDGKTDEDPVDGKDNDGDGKIDEDGLTFTPGEDKGKLDEITVEFEVTRYGEKASVFYPGDDKVRIKAKVKNTGDTNFNGEVKLFLDALEDCTCQKCPENAKCVCDCKINKERLLTREINNLKPKEILVVTTDPFSIPDTSINQTYQVRALLKDKKDHSDHRKGPILYIIPKEEITIIDGYFSDADEERITHAYPQQGDIKAYVKISSTQVPIDVNVVMIVDNTPIESTRLSYVKNAAFENSIFETKAFNATNSHVGKEINIAIAIKDNTGKTLLDRVLTKEELPVAACEGNTLTPQCDGIKSTFAMSYPFAYLDIIKPMLTILGVSFTKAECDITSSCYEGLDQAACVASSGNYEMCPMPDCDDDDITCPQVCGEPICICPDHPCKVKSTEIKHGDNVIVKVKLENRETISFKGGNIDITSAYQGSDTKESVGYDVTLNPDKTIILEAKPIRFLTDQTVEIFLEGVDSHSITWIKEYIGASLIPSVIRDDDPEDPPDDPGERQNIDTELSFGDNCQKHIKCNSCLPTCEFFVDETTCSITPSQCDCQCSFENISAEDSDLDESQFV